jgi:hypothetical protein
MYVSFIWRASVKLSVPMTLQVRFVYTQYLPFEFRNDKTAKGFQSYEEILLFYNKYTKLNDKQQELFRRMAAGLGTHACLADAQVNDLTKAPCCKRHHLLPS